jgi:transposase-like protein
MEKLWTEESDDIFDGDKVIVKPNCPICHQPMTMYNIRGGIKKDTQAWICDNENCQKSKQMLG